VSVVAALLALAAPHGAKAAPHLFATADYGLTFSVPAGASYGPLPRDWVGSDHGTIVFLEAPRHCGGAGYPSSGREFGPGRAARIEVFYAYDALDDGGPKPERCTRAGTVRFLGRTRSICRSREKGLIVETVQGRYQADQPAFAILTLVTRPRRLSRDHALLRRLAASTRPCSAEWFKDKDRKDRFVVGTGARCPATARYF
jgi:hypothetical protein